MKKTAFLLLTFVISPLTHASSSVEAMGKHTLATINDEIRITKLDLRNYATSNPYLLPQLGVQGGPMRVLDDMIKIRLLALEGQRIGQPDHGDQAGGAAGYAIAVRNRLAPSCAEATDKDALDYYQANPDKFSTPPYLRLNRYALNFTPDNRKEVEARLAELSRRLSRKETSFAEIATTSDDEISRERNGNIGFVPDNDPVNPVMARLRQAKTGEIVGPVEQGRMLFLYQVTDRREPITADFESVRKDAAVDQQAYCTRLRTDALFKELKERWKVKILVEDISVRPGED